LRRLGMPSDGPWIGHLGEGRHALPRIMDRARGGARRTGDGDGHGRWRPRRPRARATWRPVRERAGLREKREEW